jgi:hypothetical protein
MVGIDEAAVLIRGKALAAQDGFTWDIDFNGLREGWAPFRGLRFLSETRRREYLARARAELLEQLGDT